MSQDPQHFGPRPSWGRRVPGTGFSLLIGGLFMVCAGLVAWSHPMVILTMVPRPQQPPMGGIPQRVIMDGQIIHRPWGLMTSAQVSLPHISAFLMHTEIRAWGTSRGALQVATQDEVHDVLTGSVSEVIRMVEQLNSHLDGSSSSGIKIRHFDWLWFSVSWALLAIGALVLIRNGLIAPWQRRRYAQRHC